MKRPYSKSGKSHIICASIIDRLLICNWQSVKKSDPSIDLKIEFTCKWCERYYPPDSAIFDMFMFSIKYSKNTNGSWSLKH